MASRSSSQEDPSRIGSSEVLRRHGSGDLRTMRRTGSGIDKLGDWRGELFKPPKHLTQFCRPQRSYQSRDSVLRC